MARRKRDWSKTWFGITLQRVGMKETRRVMEFAVCWAMITADLGRPPKNLEEYGEWWGVSRASAYREWDSWKAAWPEYRTPTEWFAVVGLDPVEAPERGVEGLFLTGLAGVT